MPFFSVIIPLYNKEAFIGRTLQSVLAQTYTDFEVIIVNDGSTDKSEEIVKGFTDSRIRYYITPNQRVSAARNMGINLANGKIVAFLDADDHWKENHLQVLYDLHLHYPEAGLLLSRYQIKIGNNKLINPVFLRLENNYQGIVEDPFTSSLQFRLSQPSAMAVQKEVFNITGYFEESLSQMEDVDMWIRIVLYCPMAISNTYTVVYNFDVPDSLSRVKMKERKIFDFDKYKAQESKNKSLRDFIDVYRLEYSLKFRIEGNIANSSRLYKTTLPQNIPFKTKIFFLMPPAVLRLLLQVKHKLHKKGISFSVYK